MDIGKSFRNVGITAKEREMGKHWTSNENLELAKCTLNYD